MVELNLASQLLEGLISYPPREERLCLESIFASKILNLAESTKLNDNEIMKTPRAKARLLTLTNIRGTLPIMRSFLSASPNGKPAKRGIISVQ